MINHSVKVLITFVVLLFIGCDDIFEADLSGEVVVIIAPKDELQTEIQSNTFWWDTVEGAEGYNLQIVSPSFDDILRLELDTSIAINQFLYTLEPGDYQWRVCAFNYTSETAYLMHTLTIIDTTSKSILRR